jgi:arginine N-succinyltransferase
LAKSRLEPIARVLESPVELSLQEGETEMLVMRTAQMADLDPLYDLISSSTYGLTTLKISKEQLEERIEDSLYSFRRKPKRPSGQPYVFVMEDLDCGKIVGTCSIYSKVGGFEPFYAYRIESVIRESQQLETIREFQVLHLVKEHDGPTEIGSLYLSPDYRGSGNGRLLSLSRFLFMANAPERFDHQVIAEMRGRVNGEGQSPFWEAIGRHFFDIEFPKAEMLTTVSKNFIADLMPIHPIYVALLPKSAQSTIAQVHQHTEPALAMLQKEGFEHRHLIDIFDGGPVMHCNVQKVRVVKESLCGRVVEISDHLEGKPLLICNVAEEGFRCVLGPVMTRTVGREGELAEVSLGRVTAMALGVRMNDTIRFADLKPLCDESSRVGSAT